MDGASRKTRADAVRSARAIVEAAREVLAEDPAAELRLIAERSGLNRSTVYRHFPTRELLIEAVHDAYLAEMAEVIRNIDQDAADLSAELRRVTLEAHEVAARWNTYRYAPLLPDGKHQWRQGVVEVMLPFMERGRAEGSLRDDVTGRDLVMTWSMPIAFAAERINGGRWTIAEAADFTLRLMTRPT